MKKIATLTVLIGLSIPVAVIAAEPNDWFYSFDYDGNGIYHAYMPTRSTSTHAFVTGRAGQDGGAWTYVNNCFSFNPAGSEYTHHAGNYLMSFEPACFDFSQIGGYESYFLPLMDSKVSTSTLENYVPMWTFNSFHDELWNNVMSTTTTMHVTNASTTAGFMTREQSDKLAEVPDSFATVAETGAYADLTGTPTLATVATTGSYDDLSDKPSIPSMNPQSKITDAAVNASTTAATNAATNVSADSVAILGVNVPTNASYTALVAAHNALATKYNDAATKYNDAATKYNAAAVKLNAIIDALEANGILTP